MYLVNKAVINNILYDEFEERINGDLFKKVFVIDIRNFNESELNEFYNNFFDFQDELLSDTFFFKHKNLSLYIICEEDQKEDNRARKITYDLHYADKKFLTENEFSLICKYSKDSILEDNRYTFSYENKEIQIGNFNLIYGNNGSGKTRLLNRIAEECLSPLYSMLRDDGLIYTQDEYIEYLETIFNLSGKKQYFEYLIGIITEARRKEQAIIIDDMSFGSLDDLNKIRVIDILANSSKSNIVAITTCQNDIKKLVNNRVYQPNIIDL